MYVSVSAPASQPVALFAVYIQCVRNRQLLKISPAFFESGTHNPKTAGYIIMYSLLYPKNWEYARQQVHLTPWKQLTKSKRSLFNEYWLKDMQSIGGGELFVPAEWYGALSGEGKSGSLSVLFTKRIISQRTSFKLPSACIYRYLSSANSNQSLSPVVKFVVP